MTTITKLNQSDDPWSDLVISILSVNNFKLERTFALLNTLQQEGLTEPNRLRHLEPHDVFKKLIAAGYNRGDYMTYLFAERLCELGKFVYGNDKEKCEKILKSGDVKAIKDLLSQVKGVGPVVLQNYYVLRAIPS